MDQDLAQGDMTKVLKHKPVSDNKRPLWINNKILFWLSQPHSEVSQICNIDKKKK